MAHDYSFPVFKTNNNGLARIAGDKIIFIKPPAGGDYKIGDIVPENWNMKPINDEARKSVLKEGTK